ncbi:MAG: hypothetical protein QHH17_01085 [Candidatus Bathyarchaeota archaeon]|jgi:hypothetical protein|nr:hypothetical protein [Candidatus Bathyarchaeota archaeon]
MSKKRRKSIIDELFGNSFFEEFPEELEGGYSINVVQTPEGTKVHAKVGKNVDAEALKRQLQREYPNAKIEIEGGKKEPLIREISTKNIKEEKQKT